MSAEFLAIDTFQVKYSTHDKRTYRRASTNHYVWGTEIGNEIQEAVSNQWDGEFTIEATHLWDVPGLRIGWKVVSLDSDTGTQYMAVLIHHNNQDGTFADEFCWLDAVTR